MTDWENFSKGFLKDWIETLLESLEKNLDDDTRKKVMQHCGRFCARCHALEMFQDLKGKTENLDEFLEKLNSTVQGVNWTKVDDSTVTVEYEKCFCPLHQAGLVDSSTQCNCSTGWLKENMEDYFEKEVEVTLEQSVLQGYPTCKFAIKH